MQRLPKIFITAGAFAVVTAGCVSPKSPGVATDALQADIVFDVAPAELKEAPLAPIGALATDQPLEVAAENLGRLNTLPGFQNRIPARFQGVAFKPTAEALRASECAAAPLGSAPPREAPAAPPAKTPPKAGLYRYKISGSRSQTFSNGATIKNNVSGFQPRVVRNVESTSDTKWTYETVQPYGDGGIQVTQWVVNANPTQKSASTPYVGENAYRVSEPEAGLSIQQVDYYNSDGNLQSTFDPSPPVVWAQFPVLPGQPFSSVGVSPRNRQTQRLDGESTGRKSVDACGVMVDGWHINHQFTDSAQGNYKQDVVVSTDMGGLVIEQHVARSYALGDVRIDEDLTFTLGQVEPDPLPESSK